MDVSVGIWRTVVDDEEWTFGILPLIEARSVHGWDMHMRANLPPVQLVACFLPKCHFTVFRIPIKREVCLGQEQCVRVLLAWLRGFQAARCPGEGPT
jgi:hypothetical protein